MARYTRPQPPTNRTQINREQPRRTAENIPMDEDDTEVNIDQSPQAYSEEGQQPEPAAEPAPQGTIHDAEVNVASGSGLDPNQRAAQEQQEAPAPQAETAPVSHNTPPPEGVPEPEPVIDRTTVVKQARTFIDDAVAVSGWRLTPADSNTIDQRLAQLFDEDNKTPAEDLADVVANEMGMNPTWNQGGPTSMKITATQNPTPPQQ